VPLLIIEGVTAAKVQASGETKEKDNGKSTMRKKDTIESVSLNGAHAAVKLLPFPFFISCLSRSPKSVLVDMGPLLEKVTEEMNLALNENKARLLEISKSYINDYHKTKKHTLPILIGEGTGILEGGTIKDSPTAQRDRAFVYDWPFEHSAKMPIVLGDRTESPFYKTLVFGITHRFMDSLRIGTFHFATKRSDTIFYRSCLYSEFIVMDPSITIIPSLCAGYIGSERASSSVSRERSQSEFSEEMVDIIKAVVKTRQPNPRMKGSSRYPIVDIMSLSPDKIYSQEITNIQMFVTSVRNDWVIRSRLRVKNTGRVMSYSDATSIISVYFSKDTLTKDVLDKIFDYCRRFRSLDNHIIGNVVSYLEYYDENFYSYRLDFYCFDNSQ
jgi:hypothetical protein